MMFCTLTNGVVTNVYSGDPSSFKGKMEVMELPDDTTVIVGTRRGEISSDGYLRPEIERLEEGYIHLDAYHILRAGKICKKTDEELIIDGLLPIPVGLKVENGILAEMTVEEQVEAGILSLGLGDVIFDGKIIHVPTGSKMLEDGTIVPMSVKEKLDNKLLTPGYDEIYDEETDSLRKMTEIERYIANIDPLPPGVKLVNGELVPMTKDERLIAGLDPLSYNQRIVDGKIVTLTDEEVSEINYNLSRETWVNRICSRLTEMRDSILKAGFFFEENRYSADPEMQLDINNQALMLALGKTVSFPIQVRTADNTYTSFMDSDSFYVFHAAMSDFARGVVSKYSHIKDRIRASSSHKEAYEIAMEGWL